MRTYLVGPWLIFALALLAKAEPPPRQQVAQNVEALWNDLADANAARAYRAIWALAKRPKEAVSLIAGKLKPAVAPDPRRVVRLIADLDSQAFAVRENANRELIKWDELVAPALSKDLKANPSLETRQRLEKLLHRLLGPITVAEHLRAVRAVEALEYIGTSGAKALLDKYAAGGAGARLTRHANDALRRLAGNAPTPMPPSPPRIDLYGDPLPLGAVGRLGTTRFRFASEGSFGPQGLAFLPGGKKLIAADDHEVQVFEVPTGKLLHEIRTAVAIRGFALAPSGRQFAVAGPLPSSGLGAIQVCALPSGKVLRTFPRNGLGGASMVFSPDDELLFSLGGRDGILRIEGLATGKEQSQRKFGLDVSEEIALSRDGTYLAINTGVNSRKLFLWKWQDEEPRQLNTSLPGRGLGNIRFSPDGKLLAGVQDFSTLYVWQVPSGRLLFQMDCPVDDHFFLGDAAFTPGGKTLALTIRKEQSTLRGKIQLLDPATGRSQGIVDANTRARRLAFSPDSRLLATGAGVAVRLYDLATRQEVTAHLEAHESYPSQIIVSNTGCLATASDDNVVRLWDAATTKQRGTFVAEDWVRAIALSPDGRLLAASGFDDAVHIWDTGSSQQIYRLAGHGRVGGRRTLGFSPDNRSLFSWGDDFYLRVWDMKNGKARLEIRPQGFDFGDSNKGRGKKALGEAVFTPDRRTFVLDFRGQVHLFDTGTGKELLRFASGSTVPGALW
jgi:WD40 repeat protein